MSAGAIIDFYQGTGTDRAGRKIEDIWSWDDRRLEMVHDYIQWLFPLPDPSRFNPSAPLLSAEDRSAFRLSPELQARAVRSLDLMLSFLGLVREAHRIVRAPTFAARAPNWLEPANHNYLRLTRILLFLDLVGLETQARALLSCLEDIAAVEGRQAIGARTLQFWREAVTSG